MLLAAAINNREICDQIEDVKLTEEAAGLLRAIRALYDGDDRAVALSREAVETVMRAQTHDDKVADVRAAYLHSLPEGTDGTATTLLREIRLKQQRLELIDALLRDVPPADLSAQLEAYAIGVAGNDNDFAEATLDDLLSNTSDKIAILPKELNDALNGGIRPGQTLLYFGRPGAAKTLLCVETCCGLANKGKQVLYIGNEEGGSILLLRFLSRLSGIELKDLDAQDKDVAKANIRKAYDLAQRRGLKNVKIIFGVTNFGLLSKMVKDNPPACIVLDQLRHMSTGEGDGNTQMMEASQRAFRNLCNRYGIIGIAVGQAGNTAEQKLLLGMNDLDSSKTGVQGAVDVIVGIGVTTHAQAEGWRMLSICRNKVSGVIAAFKIFVNEQLTKVESR